MESPVNGPSGEGRARGGDRWSRARQEMVDKQIVARGVRDERVIAAMRRVPRHAFVPEVLAEEAYSDKALPIGYAQTISQPYMVAVCLEALALRGGERVLEIGAGSGYVTALLAELAGSVRAIERLPELAGPARARLERLGYTNFLLWAADGTYGWAEEGPYEAILAAASALEPPAPWRGQLAPGGRLVMPLGEEKNQRLVRFSLDGEGRPRQRETLVNCVFVKLVGKHGWPENG